MKKKRSTFQKITFGFVWMMIILTLASVIYPAISAIMNN